MRQTQGKCAPHWDSQSRKINLHVHTHIIKVHSAYVHIILIYVCILGGRESERERHGYIHTYYMYVPSLLIPVTMQEQLLCDYLKDEF